jgi:hypothetical protein
VEDKPMMANIAHTGRETVAWLIGPQGRRVVVVLLLALAGQLAFAAYQSAWLGLPLVREEPPRFNPAFLAQSVFSLATASLLVAALIGARARPCPLEVESSRPPTLAAGVVVLALGVAGTGLFMASPAEFHDFAQEDRPVEWLSALFLFGASAMFAFEGVRRRRDMAGLFCAGLLCLALFVIGMEEISWGQRLFGFATPERLAEVNWQAEFNFHNVQTDLSETAYYFGAGVLLIVLPLLRDLVPVSAASHRWLDFAPRRSVALVSVPLAWFNYGHWDLLPIQLATCLAFFALFAWALAAATRGDRVEGLIFLLAASVLACCQALFLAFGPALVDIPDPTEYKEFFIALGFGWYALSVVFARRSNAH